MFSTFEPALPATDEHALWTMAVPAWHFVLRAVVVYIFLLVLLRLTGKRQVGQMAPFDLVLLLVLSNAVQNAMNAGDNSITGGCILAATLVAINWIVAWLTFRSKRLEALVEGRPVLLIHNGHVDRAALDSVKMTRHELESALRSQGVTCPDEVRFAVLENNGSVSVIMRNHA